MLVLVTAEMGEKDRDSEKAREQSALQRSTVLNRELNPGTMAHEGRKRVGLDDEMVKSP